MSTLKLGVFYTAKSEEAKHRFVDEATKAGIVSSIRKEEGCLRYEYYLSTDDKKEIFLFEEWENEECQKNHLKTENMAKLAKLKEKYLDSTKILRFE